MAPPSLAAWLPLATNWFSVMVSLLLKVKIAPPRIPARLPVARTRVRFSATPLRAAMAPPFCWASLSVRFTSVSVSAPGPTA